MARLYDLKTGKRFDASCETWKRHMLNKNGTIKTRRDTKKEARLEAQGLIALRPSVTTVAKTADMGGSDGLIKWVQNLAEDLVKAGQTDVNTFKTLLSDACTKARDRGSLLHDAFDRWMQGQRDMSEQEYEMVQTCSRWLAHKEFCVDACKTEIQFCNDAYGGTCDVLVDGVVVDWKTVEKKRAFKFSEYLQAAAYAHHFGADTAYIVMIQQDPIQVIQEKEFDLYQLDALYREFEIYLEAWRSQKRIKEIAQ